MLIILWLRQQPPAPLKKKKAAAIATIYILTPPNEKMAIFEGWLRPLGVFFGFFMLANERLGPVLPKNGLIFESRPKNGLFLFEKMMQNEPKKLFSSFLPPTHTQKNLGILLPSRFSQIFLDFHSSDFTSQVNLIWISTINTTIQYACTTIQYEWQCNAIQKKIWWQRKIL